MLRFLNGFYDYPVVGDEAEILPHLRDDFSRAVILRSEERRVGKECRYRGGGCEENKNKVEG